MDKLVLRETLECTVNAADGEDMTFRVEVFERDEPASDLLRYRARVWSYELVRMTTFRMLADASDGFDAEVLVVSEMFDGMECNATDASEAAQMFLGRMLDQLGC